MKKVIIALVMTCMLLLSACSETETPSAEVTVPVNLTAADGIGEAIGSITATDTQYGVLFTPSLANLPPGIHGFHVHQNPDCGPAEKDGSSVPGLAAGGHYDPGNTEVHAGPYGDGHLGDVPPLYVAEDGTATLPVLAPRLQISDLSGRALMVHAGGDNYSDTPEPLGGGGARVACGVL